MGWSAQSGTLSDANNPTSADSFEYDNDARLIRHTRVIDGREFLTGYEYDSVGRLLTKRLPDGQRLRHHYHENGPNRASLRAITQQTLLGLREKTLLTQIDLDGRDGEVGYLSGNGLRTQQSLDRLGRVTHLDIGGQLALNYAFDAAGRIVSIDSNGNEQTYDYNAGRLSAASTVLGNFAYRYDAVGNRTSKRTELLDGQVQDTTYHLPEHGAGNRLIRQSEQVSGIEKRYDYGESGAPTMVGDVSYVYDTLDRPIEVYRQDQLLARYQYNAFGERVKKTVYASHGTPRITYFLYDGSSLTAEIDETGTIESQYLYIEGSRPVALLRNQSVFAIHSDHQGSPRMMSDESGAIVWQAEYTPFGKAEILREEQTLNLRLAGQYADAETGTHYNYFRDYDPETGRYLSSDPMGLLAGLNTYAYVNGNPLGGIDPLGLLDSSTYYVTTAAVASSSTVWTWLAALGTATVGAVSAPVWIVGGVVVGVTVAAAAIYFYNGHGGDEETFANDFGAPPRESFDNLLAQLMEYDPGLATTIEWGDSWESILQLQQTLLDAQQQYVNDQNAILAQNPGGICLLPAAQALYDQALDALETARLGQQAAQNSMVGDQQEQVLRDGVLFPSEAAYQAARFNYDAAGGVDTGLSFQQWWESYEVTGTVLESWDTISSNRQDALDKALEANGIPAGTEPDEVVYPDSLRGTEEQLRRDDNVVLYLYIRDDGEIVYVREDRAVLYGDGGAGDQTTHFNAGTVQYSLEQHHYFP